jgi:hypothetical protein
MAHLMHYQYHVKLPKSNLMPFSLVGMIFLFAVPYQELASEKRVWNKRCI